MSLLLNLTQRTATFWGGTYFKFNFNLQVYIPRSPHNFLFLKSLHHPLTPLYHGCLSWPSDTVD